MKDTLRFRQNRQNLQKKPGHQTRQPSFQISSGNPAIRLRRTRGFPSPDYSGFGFFMRIFLSLFQFAFPETAITEPKRLKFKNIIIS
jgi:hypothetical protein